MFYVLSELRIDNFKILCKNYVNLTPNKTLNLYLSFLHFPLVWSIPDEIEILYDTDIPNEMTPMIPKRKVMDSSGTSSYHILQNVTIGYKITNYLQQQFEFYYPRRDQQPIEQSSYIEEEEEEGMTPFKKYIQPPSLERAWNFVEYQCLPRRFKGIFEDKKGRKYLRAGAGEKKPTLLYPVYDTPTEDMADFGIGVGMYFKFVQFFGIVTFLAGCLSLPVMKYYKYGYNNFKLRYNESEKSLMGRVDDYSAVCIDTSFQPCPSCKMENAMHEYQNRFYVDESGLPFILVNRCQVNNVLGFFSYVTMLFVICAVYYFVYAQRKVRIELDEGEQTSSDYSIHIHVSKLILNGCFD